MTIRILLIGIPRPSQSTGNRPLSSASNREITHTTLPRGPKEPISGPVDGLIASSSQEKDPKARFIGVERGQKPLPEPNVLEYLDTEDEEEVRRDSRQLVSHSLSHVPSKCLMITAVG